MSGNKRDTINQAVLAGVPKVGGVGDGSSRPPQSPVTKMGQLLVGGLGRENEELKSKVAALEAERHNGEVILEVSPKEIGHSKFVNRHALSLQLSDEDFAKLVNSFRSDGQDQEIVVRPTPSDATHSHPYEIGYGHRRHAAALILDAESPTGWKVKVRAKPLTDRQLVDMMDRENDFHKALSAYERGWEYSCWLKEGVYESQAEIARVKGLTESTVTRYIQVSKLPKPILEAFGDPRAVNVNWISDLGRALRQNEAAVMAAAERIRAEGGNPKPEAVLASLLRAGQSPANAQRAPADEQTIRIPGSNRVGIRTVRRRGSLRVKWGPGVDEGYQERFALAFKEFALEHLQLNPPSETSRPPGSNRRKR